MAKFIFWFFNILGYVATVYQIMLWTGFALGHRIVKIPETSITPKIYLFPGSTIRFDAQFEEVIPADKVDEANWKIDGPSYEGKLSGLNPTMRIPPRGGIYKVGITAQVRDESNHRSGFTSFYVVQDEPEQTRVNKGETAPVEIESLSPDMIAKANEQGLEIYAGDKGWIEGEGVRIDQSLLKFSAPILLNAVQGRVFFRVKGEESAQAYGSATLPQNRAPKGIFKTQDPRLPSSIGD